jgi:hypothetical protein
MVDQDKLIKKGIKYTDTLFDEISKRVESGVRTSDTLEAFLNKTKGYTENNPLVTSGYDKEMLKIILEETNNHKFSRPSQKELVRVTIENQVGELIKDVGDDLKDTVRQIVKTGYNENWSQDKIAEEISGNILTLRNKRARTIARTEIARTATISDYIINKEMGATHFYVECRNTACPICKAAWHKHWKPENDDSFTPKETTAGGKGWVGDNKFSMTDTKMLPPIHPNCRCVPYFISDEDGKPVKPQPDDVPDPTPEQLKKNLTPAERDKYENYKRNIPRQIKWLQDNPNAAPEEIAKHQKRLNFMQKKLNELKRKAVGGSVGKPAQPKKQPQPKPQPQAKPKTPKKQAEPKQSQPKLQPYDTGLPQNKKLSKTEINNLPEQDRKRYRYLKRYMERFQQIHRDHVNYTEAERQDAWNRMVAMSDEWKKLNRKAVQLNRLKRRKEAKTFRQTPKSQKNVKSKSEPIFDKSKILTKEQLDKMSMAELAQHHNANYKGVEVHPDDNRRYHTFEQKFDNGETFVLRFDEKAVNSYNKKGIATANEIIDQVFKVPAVLRQETREIWFKDTQKGLHGDTLGERTGGYNMRHRYNPFFDGFDHKIVINPKYFKGGGRGQYAFLWNNRDPNDARDWKMTIVHEFNHSGDWSQDIWDHEGGVEHSAHDEYKKIVNEEGGFTWYANTQISEDYAEHGGYIGYMETNPSEQHKKIKIERYENGRFITKQITYEEYKQMYPKHYAYFMKKFKEGF